jgi:Raf kinase inhibitor-like YbhB/YbcL family protein
MPMVKVVAICCLTMLASLPATSLTAEATEKRLTPRVDIKISSSSFQDGQSIPKLYTADGQDISPELKWQGTPPSTKSFVLICDDPDAPMGTWTHWLLYAIPSNERELQADLSKQSTLANGSKQGTNSFGRIGYGGPAPPPGKTHRYFFKLFALDTVLDLRSGVNAAVLERAMSHHILAQGQLMGRYSR